MGSGGVGWTGHLGGELLQMMAGIKLTHVPYRGEAPAMTDLIAGHCQMVIARGGSAMEYCKAGSVRAIAVTLDMKLDALPDVKPLSDLLPGYMAIGFGGLVAPKNVPADISRCSTSTPATRSRNRTSGSASSTWAAWCRGAAADLGPVHGRTPSAGRR